MVFLMIGDELSKGMLEGGPYVGFEFYWLGWRWVLNVLCSMTWSVLARGL